MEEIKKEETQAPIVVQEKEEKSTCSGHLYCWGLGEQFALGTGKNNSESVPVRVKVDSKAQQVSTGGYFTISALENGDLYVWGSGSHGQLGTNGDQDKALPVKISTPGKVLMVAAGNWHSLILLENYRVFGSGHNKYGALGVGDTENRAIFTEVKFDPEEPVSQIAAGDGYSLFITKKKNELFTCGFRLQNGHQKDQHVDQPQKITSIKGSVIAMSAGFTYAACVDESGIVYTWGDGGFLQLGHGDKNPQKQPKMVEKLKDVKIRNVSCCRGEQNCHTAAIDEQGRLYTWGSGYKGQLGHAEEWSHSDPADEKYPQFVEFLQDTPIDKVICAGIHTGVITQAGDLLTFGCGSDGRLGHPESDNHVYLYRQGFPRQIEAFKDQKVLDFSLSYYHGSCIVEI